MTDRNSSGQIVLSPYKAFDDLDYRELLRDFRRCHPAEYDRWTTIERESFEQRRGLAAYPDQALMKFIQAFIADRTVDQNGGLGASVAFRVLSGHILRSWLAEVPDLNPAPGRILITEPLSHSDAEQRELARLFNLTSPQSWNEWRRIEAGNWSSGDPLRPISIEFHAFLRAQCWIQSVTAAISAFSRMRRFILADLRLH